MNTIILINKINTDFPELIIHVSYEIHFYHVLSCLCKDIICYCMKYKDGQSLIPYKYIQGVMPKIYTSC